MTDTQRHTAIIKLIDTYTAANTIDSDTARRALIAEGIYTKKGKLQPEFGGPARKAKTKA